MLWARQQLFLLFSLCFLPIFPGNPSPTHAAEKTYTNSIGMEFVLIAPGCFNMGLDQDSDKAIVNKPSSLVIRKYAPLGQYAYGKGIGDEKSLHYAGIAKPFYLGKYEVTQEQWQRVMGENPSWFKTGRLNQPEVRYDTRNHPVEHVSWVDAHIFINRLNKLEGGKKYRLPTEMEWEYAARASSGGAYFFDDKENLRDYAWYDGSDDGIEGTRPVGRLRPNAWGLHDMLGNVWEWTLERTIRGGGWSDGERGCRVYSRLKKGLGRNTRSLDLGFRLALSPE
ncbi:MAG: formylglycine-generating enzyme family protein [Desulfovibrio sp.]|nr:formylglycine-generating enzyme family protein [Desulfovibrio sp.]